MRLQCSPRIATLFCLSLLLVSSPGLAQMDKTIEVMPIANAPFMAFIDVEQIRTKEDGSPISVKTREMIARDSRGRVFRDIRPQAFNYLIVFAESYDPKSEVYTFMNGLRHVYWVGKLDHQPEGLSAGFFYASEVDKSHPAGDFAGDDLGTQVLEGVPVRGVRKVEKIQEDTGRSAVVTKEYWYSDELHINLVAKYNDPAAVFQTMTVVRLVRGEADAGLFEGPSPDLKRVDTPSETLAP
jgi:hypothetical protein